MSHRKTATILALTLFASGCITTVGSRTVPPARFNYNEAMAQSWNEQLLLNLVRARYRDTTRFIEVSSILTSYSFTGSGTLSATAGLSTSSSDSATPSATLSYTESPTITYIPLQGEDFARRLLSPISAETLGLLADTGRNVETLLLCCAEMLNDLHNAPAARGPTSTTAPRYEVFHRATKLLGELQATGGIDVITDSTGESSIEIDPTQKDQLTSQIAELQKLLQLDTSKDSYNMVWDSAERKSDEIAIEGRSLLEVLYFLSHGVEPPAEHEAGGLVTITRDASGQPFDWSQVTGRLMRIRSAKEPPKGAYVRIRYRGHWYFIDDSDLTSKATFNLLTYLFSLQSISSNTVVPSLTVSAGGG